MENLGYRSAASVAVRTAFEETRQRFAGLLERRWSGQPLLVAAFQQLEACLAASEQLEQQHWRQLRDRVAARWRSRSEAACQRRLAQLADRRRQLTDQQQQLNSLLAEAQRQLQLTIAPPADLPSRLLRKWERIRRTNRDGAGPGEAERQQEDVVAAPPPPPQTTLKPWLIAGLSLEETCDRQRLLERSRGLDAETARLLELRDTQYRSVTDYSHCLSRYLSCLQKSRNSTNELMKTRASLRLHAAWVRDHHRRLADRLQRQRPAAGQSADPMNASAELQNYDRLWEEGLEVPCTTAGASVGAAAAVRSVPPLSERLLHSRLDAAESRALVAAAAERGTWYEVEFALAHDRLTLTADCVSALLACCRCRGRCQCQWTRLAAAAQRRVPERTPRTAGWGWRKLRMATQLIRLLHSTKAEG